MFLVKPYDVMRVTTYFLGFKLKHLYITLRKYAYEQFAVEKAVFALLRQNLLGTQAYLEYLGLLLLF